MTATAPARVTDGVVVPAGGRASRMGGVRKPLLTTGGRTLLELAVHAVPGAAVVVVGPDDLPVPEAVRLVREEPWFGGPVAALRAGCAALPADVDRIWALAADQPRVQRLVGLLRAARPGPDGVIGVDDGGRLQPLAACYRGAALREALRQPPRRLLDLIAPLALTTVPLGDDLDVDTPQDVARHGLQGPGEPR